MIVLVMAIAVTLPIPLGNWLPSLSVAMIGLALGERDGVCLAAGCGIGLSRSRSSASWSARPAFWPACLLRLLNILARRGDPRRF
jgi:hypothetical protein